jgi:hypothetical protein
MLKKMAQVLFLIFPVGVSAGVDGVWQCNVKVVTTAKANGRVTRGTDFSSGTQTLFPDGTYTSVSPVSPIVAHGTYTVKKRTIQFYPNYEDLITIAEQACSQGGASCFVSAVSAKSTATSNKAFTAMKGKGTLKMSILVNGSVLVRTVGASTLNCAHQ